MVETHKRKRKNTVITKITLTISNALKPYRYQQHLPTIFQNVSGAVQIAIRYERNTCTVVTRDNTIVDTSLLC